MMIHPLKRLFYTLILFSNLLAIYPASSVNSESIPYGVGPWPDSLGNHRAVIRVNENADAVRVHIPWRRRDHNPEQKRIIMTGSLSDRSVTDVFPVGITRVYGDIVFRPKYGAGTYYLYYLPTAMTGWKYMPDVEYLKPEQNAEKSWLDNHSLQNPASGKWKNLPEAVVVEFQSISEFHSFYPMEIIASPDETGRLIAEHPQASYFLFPEDRTNPVKMTGDLPLKWIRSGPRSEFEAKAARGEFYAFQIGIFACRKRVDNIKIRFGELKHSGGGGSIPASAMRCFNTGGIDWTGKSFDKQVDVETGKVGVLWCGVQVPKDITPGIYRGTLIVTPGSMKPSVITLKLTITEDILDDSGDSEPRRHSRLRWLDSTIALDNEIVAPFTPLKVSGRNVSCLGRSVKIGDSGLPESITSMFTPEMTGIGKTKREVLAKSVEFELIDAKGHKSSFRGNGVKILNRTNGAVTWQASGSAGNLKMECQAKMEFDGHIAFDVTISAVKDAEVSDIRLNIPFKADVAKYMMGMGLKGGYSREYQWEWDRDKLQDTVWIGDVNAGLQCRLKGENYSRPLINIYYHYKPLNMPPAWYNGGNGGCSFRTTEDGAFVLSAYSGERTIKAGEKLQFDFTLLLTPFKPLDTDGQWSTRYYHAFKPVEEILETGANTINIHHATETNPYINYPFHRTGQMKAYIDDAHDNGLKVKIYYTVRELTNHVVELWALRSLGNEILAYGPGGGYSWLQEHLGSNYIRAWYDPNMKDAAIITSGMSRWHNYYLEGLDWLMKNVGIDGIYIDDVAYDREVMKRVRKILDRNSKGALIDLHSWNHFNDRAGFASCANLYMEHLPYVNRIWFGEGFDYDSAPDYWMVEITGIPFGVMGEMLQGGGNTWRGMLYGMTNRLPWAGDPRPVWKVWDDFGISEAEMTGYWSPRCPVKTGREDILATAYVKEGAVLIAVASWAEETVKCRLEINWDAVGLNPVKTLIKAPKVENFQEAAVYSPADEIPIEPGKGCLLILSGN